MKNQYFADVHDFRKFGLLRQLAKSGLDIGVCWMLTTGDGGGDGNQTNYLVEREKWRVFDPKLYDELSRTGNQPQFREVASARKWGLIPRAIYFEEYLSDVRDERLDYFARALNDLEPCDLVFFDPDNGLQVPSVPIGRKNSSKYLYWSEVETAYGLGKSTLVYQHFPRENRASYTLLRGQEMAEHTSTSTVFALATTNVLFLLAAQPQHDRAARDALSAVIVNWPGQIEEIASFTVSGQ